MYHLNLLNRLYLKALFAQKKKNTKFNQLKFCKLFNLRSLLRRKKVRITRDTVSENFTVVEKGHEPRSFENKIQNFYLYQDGLSERNRALANSYLLNEIVWDKENVVIDCGANVGDFYFAVKSLDVEHVYYGIEPSPKEFACLQRNIPNHTVLNFGLWEISGSFDFYVSMDNADSSFIRPQSFTDIQKIQTFRLDTLEINHEIITLLKLEAEGAELEVLKGSVGILDKVKYISADLGFEREGESPLAEVTNFLHANNFQMVKFGAPRIVCLFKNRNL
jgi:FkbM family methyltransferase